MLTQEALKHTPEDHPDHLNLKNALARISEIVDLINERTRLVKHITDLQNIEKKLATKNQVSALLYSFCWSPHDMRIVTS